ncbi:MAG: aspartate aminotransferase family protein [Proteobacteria bacterium]|nr:aspartate aminotransferase family protein [Pseudomonadota bacterium]MDA1063015.1 aspartate aminotransferase family protein [Pseudomonadota bacterium]
MSKNTRSIPAPTQLPKVSHGVGSYVFDSTGKRYIDGSGGPAVYCLGHAHPEVKAAIRDQLERIAHGYRYTFTSDPLIRLTELIQSQAGPGFEQLLYVSSGSEAVESALKIALQFHWARGDHTRTRFVSRQRSYHGNTLGALAVSGFAQRRKQFEGSLFPCSFISTANAYRPAAAGTADELTDFLAAEFEQEILRLGADNVAAFIFEPVVGAAGGMLPAPDGYARKMRDVCNRYGVLMIADEVMCGAGRCGSWRALEQDQVLPDIMTIAKGLGGGYIPLGAVAYSQQIADTIIATDGAVNTGHTFTGHTLACAAAAAVQDIVVRDQLVQRVKTHSAALQKRLVNSVGQIDAVGDIRVRGFFAGVELVADRDNRRAFDLNLKLTEIVRARTLQEGLICYPVSGTIDGAQGDVVIIAPPYNASDAELDEIADKLNRGLQLALADIGAA